MNIRYNLQHPNGIFSVVASTFKEALQKLNENLGTEYIESQVRLKSAIRIE